MDAVKGLLLQGITPQKLALSLACGILLGVFPVMGTTTALCAVAALVLRLNLPASQLVNYAIYPLQLALIVPFIRMGQRLTRSQQTRMTLAQMVQLARTDQMKAFHLLWRMALQGIVAWAIFAAIALPLFYWLLFRAIRRIQCEIQTRRVAAELA